MVMDFYIKQQHKQMNNSHSELLKFSYTTRELINLNEISSLQSK